MTTNYSVNDDAACSKDIHQSDYRGLISVTEDSYVCQAWTAQSPHAHVPGLESNYCRNPDGEPQVWCFTTSLVKRWSYCNIPTCIALEHCSKGEDQSNYHTSISVTEDGYFCQDWTAQSPHIPHFTPENSPNAGLESNYCRNPNGFSTYLFKRWSYCNVPICATPAHSISPTLSALPTVVITSNISPKPTNDSVDHDAAYSKELNQSDYR